MQSLSFTGCSSDSKLTCSRAWHQQRPLILYFFSHCTIVNVLQVIKQVGWRLRNHSPSRCQECSKTHNPDHMFAQGTVVCPTLATYVYIPTYIILPDWVGGSSDSEMTRSQAQNPNSHTCLHGEYNYSRHQQLPDCKSNSVQTKLVQPGQLNTFTTESTIFWSLLAAVFSELLQIKSCPKLDQCK